jgi:heme A synthase
MTMLDAFNTAAAGILSAMGAWAVMSPRVRCGLVAHLGLALISFGFFALFLMGLQPYSFQDANAAAEAFVHLGLVLCAIGYVQRARRRGHQRRASDWVERRR